MVFRKMFGLKAGSSEPQKPTKKDKVAAENAINAVGNLNDNEERLEKKRALLEKKMDEELAKAKALNSQNKKQQALLALKKKKMYETQLEQTNNLILRLNEQRLMLENQRATVEVVQSMHNAATAAKQTMQALNVDRVDDLLANIGEQNDEMMAVQEALAQPTVMGDMDDEELAGELEMLQQEVLDEELLKPAPVPASAKADGDVSKLPAAPKTSQVDDELADFEAELAA